MTQVKINPKMCDKLRAELETAFADIKSRLGVEIKVGKMTYEADGSQATAKITMLGTDDSGKTISPEYKALLGAVGSFPWLAGKIEQPFSDGKEKLQLTGFNHRARKFPFMATYLTGGMKGRGVGFTIAHLQNLLTK